MPRKVNRRMEGTELNEKRSFAIVLGQVIQEFRSEKKKSLLDVAVAARISEGTLCRYEYGSRIEIPLSRMTLKDIEAVAKLIRLPDIFTAYKICAALNISLDQLMARCFEVIEEIKHGGENGSE